MAAAGARVSETDSGDRQDTLQAALTARRAGTISSRRGSSRGPRSQLLANLALTWRCGLLSLDGRAVGVGAGHLRVPADGERGDFAIRPFPAPRLHGAASAAASAGGTLRGAV